MGSASVDECMISSVHLNRKERIGLLYAFLGVFLFSLSLPMTKWALEGFDPFLTAMSRPMIASAVAIPLMLIYKVPRFPRKCVKELVFVTLGAAFGWPILIALALQRTTSAHVAIIVAIMPLTTAVMAVLRTRKHVSWQFWLASTCGTLLLILFALSRGGGTKENFLADILTLLAVLFSSFCYVEGAELTKIMPGWQVISWVVVIALPLCIPASIFIWAKTHSDYTVTTHAIIGLGMIGLSSMYLGFFAWYRGLRCGYQTWFASPTTSSDHDTRLVGSVSRRESDSKHGADCTRSCAIGLMGSFDESKDD